MVLKFEAESFTDWLQAIPSLRQVSPMTPDHAHRIQPSEIGRRLNGLVNRRAIKGSVMGDNTVVNDSRHFRPGLVYGRLPLDHLLGDAMYLDVEIVEITLGINQEVPFVDNLISNTPNQANLAN